MIVDRRTVMKAGATGLLFAGARVRLVGAAEAAGDGLYLGARTTFDGVHGFAGFTPDGGIRFEAALPGRGHGCALRPGAAEVVAFARRPGRFMAVIDTATGRIVRRQEAADHRHYFGHGVFAPDGGTLYVTESAYDDAGGAVGMIGVYDAQDGYRRIGEFPVDGIGPHEISLLPDGRTLVAGVGGILTHPDTGRAKLNIATMDPSLSYYDRETGRLLERWRPPASQRRNSIRHIAVARNGLVAAVLQYQGPRSERPPLVMLHRRGEASRFLTAPGPVQDRMHNYCGSVAIDAPGRVAAVSAPRGGIVTFWALPDGVFAGALEMPDGCGIAPDGAAGGFVITSGTGQALMATAEGGGVAGDPLALAARRWDNHLIAARRT